MIGLLRWRSRRWVSVQGGLNAFDSNLSCPGTNGVNGFFADSCYAQDREDRGVTVYKPDKFYNGYTLFCHSYENPKTDSEDGLGLK